MSKHPPDVSQLPRSPPDPRKRAVSPPPTSYTPPSSPTTSSIPTNTPGPPPAPCTPPVHFSSSLPSPRQAVPRPPTRFDWAEDAATLPIAPNLHPRDFSGLRTGRTQPFGTIQRHTRRRRAPPRSSIPSRQFFHPPHVSPPHAQPFITRRHPSGIGPGKPTVTVPLGTPAPAPTPSVVKLDWDQDPRLVDLSLALRALGWTPPC
jgi:hypothetical protein